MIIIYGAVKKKLSEVLRRATAEQIIKIEEEHPTTANGLLKYYSFSVSEGKQTLTGDTMPALFD